MAYVKRLMREAARDFRLDARLSKECASDVSAACLSVGGQSRREGREGGIG